MSEKRNLAIRSWALSEIFILILAVFAFSFFISDSVSAKMELQFDFDALDINDLSGLTSSPPTSSVGTGSSSSVKKHPVPEDGNFTPEDGNSTEGGNLITSIFGGTFFLKDASKNIILGGVPAHLLSGLAYAGVAAGVTYMVAGFLGASNAQAKAASYAVALGAGIARFGYLQATGVEGQKVFAQEFFTKLGFANAQNAFLWGIGIAVVAFVLLYKDTSTEKITFECLPWEAPLGGKNCEVCNEDENQPCSEYRCKSLGQACDIVNKGTSDEECVWVNPNDVVPPKITPWDDPLTEGHRYTNHDQLPPSLGAKIVRGPDECIQAFTPLQFGIFTDEPAQCKIDIVPNTGSEEGVFDAMEYYFGDNFFAYNHTEQLSLPSPESLKNTLNGTDNPEIPTDGIYNFYVRCRDANGNFNVQEFVFQMCVDPSPDTTPPVIVDTSIVSGSYVSYGIDEVDVNFYVNEPADCRWDIESKDFDEMTNSMECSSEIYEINTRQLYTCSSTLTGIMDRQDNDYYVRCKDQPTRPDNERNVNVQSYEYVLKGSQPLDIIDLGPNETIFGSTGSVEVELYVETSNGAEEGKAICYFSNTGDEGSYVAMFETDSFEHRQLLQLTEGDYTYYYRCVDAGGNSAEDSVDFRVEVDEEPPQVTRAYRELDGLKVVTNEDARCVYGLNSCNYVFDEGLKMIYSNPLIKTSHYAEWDFGTTYYIKCRDDYGNEPAPSACSLIASASNVR